MKHRVSGKKFNRHLGARKGLEFSLLVSLLDKKSINTTLVKAKYIRPKAEKLVTKAKKGDSLANRRYLLKKLRNNKNVVDKLLVEYSAKYKNINGGYTRIQRTTQRSGDNAQMAVLSFIEPKTATKSSNADSKKSAKTKKGASKVSAPKKKTEVKAKSSKAKPKVSTKKTK